MRVPDRTRVSGNGTTTQASGPTRRTVCAPGSVTHLLSRGPVTTAIGSYAMLSDWLNGDVLDTVTDPGGSEEG